MFGAGMYFAKTAASAKYKSLHDNRSDSAIVIAEVDLGVSLVVSSENRFINLAFVRARGANSVMGRRSPNSDWEFVVYEPSRVNVKRVEFSEVVKPLGPIGGFAVVHPETPVPRRASPCDDCEVY
jgi:hypothetical protein